MIGQDLVYAAALLKDNEVVAIPTETVYGLAGNALSEVAVNKIFAAKQRPLSNPLIVHVCDKNMVYTLANEVPNNAKKLIEAFWPGPLTIILPKKNIVPDITTAGLPNVAIRMPEHPLTLELLSKLDFPLAAPSANPFGYISPTKATHVHKQLSGKIPYILDGGACEKGIESTVVGFENGEPVIYRLGALSLEQLKSVVSSSSTKNETNLDVGSPGLLPFHYAPKTRLILTHNIEKELARSNQENIGLLSFSKKISHPKVSLQIVLSSSRNIDEAARKLFDGLHELDALKLPLIIAEYMPENGIGIAMNERLEKAAAKTNLMLA